MTAVLLPNHFSNLSLNNFFTPTPIYSLPSRVQLSSILPIATVSSLALGPTADKTMLSAPFEGEFLEDLEK
jgi:hypothetical protein